MIKQADKSIDGVTPSKAVHQRQIYIARQRKEDQRTRVISIRNRRNNPMLVDTPIKNRRRFSLHHSPAVDNSIFEGLDRKEVVLRLPKRLSIRAGLGALTQYLLIAAVAVAAAYSTSIGQWFVLGLAVYVLVRRLDSSITFGIALFILISVPIFQLINQTGVANNMAVYVFELLLLGTIQALIEIKWPKMLPKPLDK